MLGYRLYRDLAPRLADHVAQPRADGPAADRLRVARRACRGPRVTGSARHAALAQRNAGRAREGRARCCSTTCAASWRSRSTTSTKRSRSALTQRLEPAARSPVGARRERAPRYTRRVALPTLRTAGRLPRLDVPVARAAASASSFAAAAPFRIRLSRSRSTTPTAIIGDAPRGPARRRPRRAGREPERPDDVPGYQLAASALRWLAGDGTRPFHDPIRVPNGARRRRPPQPVLRRLLPRRRRATGRASRRASTRRRCPPTSARSARSDFRERHAARPLLLADDGARRRHRRAERRQPAQRAADAGELRAAQRPRRPQRPAGARLHLLLGRQPARPVLLPPPAADGLRPGRRRRGSTWPTRTSSAPTSTRSGWPRRGMSLGRSLTDMLDVAGEPPTLAAAATSKRADIDDPDARADAHATRAATRRWRPSSAICRSADWWTPTLARRRARAPSPLDFERACDRWREPLPRRARAQREAQHEIDRATQSRSPADTRRGAAGCAREAEAQLELLRRRRATAASQSDFYSYRYFASEGFLPGYSFPRLPAVGLHPGAAAGTGSDEFLSRPRFLAITEFGPRQLRLPRGLALRDQPRHPAGVGRQPIRRAAARSSRRRRSCCGDVRLPPPAGGAAPAPTSASTVAAPLPAPMRQLFRLQNVATRAATASTPTRRSASARASRSGPASASPSRTGSRPCRRATIEGPTGRCATLTYGHAATLWRINLGWSAADATASSASCSTSSAATGHATRRPIRTTTTATR